MSLESRALISEALARAAEEAARPAAVVPEIPAEQRAADFTAFLHAALTSKSQPASPDAA